LEITKINGVNRTVGQTFWSLWVNFKYANVGGGQLQIKKGDSVLWALIPQAFIGPGIETSWSTRESLILAAVPVSIPLKLKGPRIVPPNVEFVVTVINGSDRSPVRHAIVRYRAMESMTDKYGMARVTLPVGNHTLIARRDDDIASNALEINAE
jgi:Domain of unknown function (DUF4430)